MWYCVQIMSSSLDPSIWYPSQACSGDETRSFGLLCRLLTYPLCLLNENSLLISELKSGIQLTCTKPEWVWTVIWKPHVMPAAKVTLMPDTATFFFSKSQTRKVIQCEPHYKQWMVCLVPWDGSEHSMTEKERARLTWQSNKTFIET